MAKALLYLFSNKRTWLDKKFYVAYFVIRKTKYLKICKVESKLGRVWCAICRARSLFLEDWDKWVEDSIL